MIENQNSYPMNLLVTLDRNYVPQLNVMLFSALQSAVSYTHLTLPTTSRV